MFLIILVIFYFFAFLRSVKETTSIVCGGSKTWKAIIPWSNFNDGNVGGLQLFSELQNKTDVLNGTSGDALFVT